jgi:hypothetical protein
MLLPLISFSIMAAGHMAGAFVPHIRYRIPPPQDAFLTSRLSSTAIYSAAEQRAKEVFASVDVDDSGTVSASELGTLLGKLDIEASNEDAQTLFKYLDLDGDGEISFDEFAPWYENACTAAELDAEAVQNTLMDRRTVLHFDQTQVPNDVLRRAVQCAIRAPNYSGSEPWRFIQIGHKTAAKLAQLRADMESGKKEPVEILQRQASIPGWCVVTTKINPQDSIVEQEDFAATSCAVQNFMLSMWSEGVGSRFYCGPVTQTQEYADLCGVDTSMERVLGCVWYGFARGGLASVEKGKRTKGVDDVLSSVT